MSCDSTVPPSAAGLTHADTLKSLAGLMAGPLVATAPLVPPRTTSGLNRSPVFHVALPVPVAASDPAVSAAEVTWPETLSLSAHTWAGGTRSWAGCAVKVAVPEPRVA